MSMSDKFDAASRGIALMLDYYMKLQGWLPVSEYYDMVKKGVGLDWVLVLTVDRDGFSGLPDVAEFCPCDNLKDGKKMAGWYDVNNQRVDNDFTKVAYFKCFTNPLMDLGSYIEEQKREVLQKMPDWKFDKDEFNTALFDNAEDKKKEYVEYLYKYI